MMRNLKKFVAVVCSLTMIASSSVVAFAGDNDAAGTGNVLAYSLESVIVPTSIKIALNPGQLPVTTKAEVKTPVDATYEADASITTAALFAENKGYLFKDDQGTPVAAADDFVENTTYYREKTPAVAVADAVTSTAQVVSFNYGLANFSTADKDVTVSITATGTASEDNTKQDIIFVDDIKKAQVYDASSNADGAKLDELKMYLAIVAAKEAPQENATTSFGITAITGGKDITNVTAKNLADVSMTNADNNAGAVAFTADTTAIAKADIAFKLDAAKYQVRDYMTVDWDTTQTALKDMMEVKSLGGITGFTFIGAMNPNADWTTAKFDAITFTPEYTVSKVTETEVADGGHKQIKTTPDTYTVTYNANYVADGADAAETATETVNTNAHPTGTGDGVVALKTREGYTFKFWGASATATEAADLEEISAATTLYAIWEQDITDAAAYGQWDGSTIWLAVSATTGFSGETVTVEVTKDGETWTTLASDKYEYDEAGWIAVTYANISAAAGGDPTVTSYIRVIDGTNRYTFTDE